MAGRGPSPFTCLNCKALYQLVKVEAGLETVDRAVTCLVCGAPLPNREGEFVLKYFLLRKAARRKPNNKRGLGGARAMSKRGPPWFWNEDILKRLARLLLALVFAA
jgi:hypothetical protein